LSYHDIRRLPASATEEFDLYGGLVDVFGATINFTTVRSFCIINRNESSKVNNILEIGGATNAWATWAGHSSDTIKIGPGGAVTMWNPSAAGFVVTNSTGDKLKVVNTGGDDTLEYQITIIGD